MDADYHAGVVASEHTGNVPERLDLKKWLVRRVECMRGHIVSASIYRIPRTLALITDFNTYRTSMLTFSLLSVSMLNGLTYILLTRAQTTRRTSI